LKTSVQKGSPNIDKFDARISDDKGVRLLQEQSTGKEKHKPVKVILPQQAEGFHHSSSSMQYSMRQ
jgi:hypothetical protein